MTLNGLVDLSRGIYQGLITPRYIYEGPTTVNYFASDKSDQFALSFSVLSDQSDQFMSDLLRAGQS